MSDVITSNVSAKLDGLRQRFREKAVHEFEVLCSIGQAVASQTADCEQLAHADHSLHRLAGSAGTFGFSSLGEEARRLELLVKPAVDLCKTGADSGLANLDDEMARDFGQRLQSLQDFLDAGGEPTTRVVAKPPESASNEPLVLVIEPDAAQADNLVSGLGLYGYRVQLVEDLQQWQAGSAPTPPLVIVRDQVFLAGGGRLNETFADLPIVCIGATDCYRHRYALANEGADAFFCEPLNLPLFANHLDNLLTDRADAESGRVLIVDDDQELMEHYSLVLSAGGIRVKTVIGDPGLLLPALSEFRPDILLMDLQMEDISGMALARMLRFEPEWLSLPIIYLSAESDRERQLEALARGGDDFLTKPLSDSFLLRTIRVRCYRAKQLNNLVSRDSMTGLLKHSLVKSEAASEHARCERMGYDSAIAMLDLDHFKRVNDSHGHRAGDVVIKGLANLLRRRLRKTDVIGRYGGEEFMVVLPDCPMGQAELLLNDVCKDFSKIAFEGKSGEFNVSLSVGLASLASYGHPEEAIEAADRALYERKRSGRNGVTVAFQ
ncbi:diguanylate cyclase [Marinobacter confluentis]|uniref:diguanylate cyclase n=1 Tax=Marinobacter confluentis TaxID=1697557 RepID=A0A4Z1BW08_9GAMM|nr:diguanylate cyclase [Marinobacter confluentis]TGN38830.1 diguanylate cyclase [Marinobacter confluentis]